MAGNPVRELITRVKFQLDQQSVNNVNKAIENAKKKLDGLSKNKTIKINVSASTAKITQLNALLNSLKNKSIKVNINSASVNGTIQQIKTKLASVIGKINVSVNMASVNSAIQQIKTKLASVIGKINVSVNMASVNSAIQQIKTKLANVTGKVKVSVNSASINSAIQQIKNKLQNINLNAHINANVAGMTIRANVVNLHGVIHGNNHGGNSGGSSLGSAGDAMGGLAAAYGGYVGISQITDAADEMMNLDGRLRTVTKDEQERLAVETELYQMGQRTRQEMSSLGKLYFGVARASEELGFSQQDNLQVTETVSKALVVGGASAAEASSTILQLSQALGSGRLQGDELRSLDENASALMKHVAEYFGTNVAGLKQMGAEGQLTSEELMKAIMSSSAAIDKEFKNMPVTFGQSMTMMSNSWDRFILTIQQKSGIFSDVAQGIAKAFERLGKELESLGNSDFFSDISSFLDSFDGVEGNLSDQIADIVEQLLKIGMVIAPIVAGLLAFQGLAFVFEPLVSAATALEGALAGIGIGLAPLAAMFGLLAVGIKWASENWDEAVAMFQPGIDLMIDGVQKLQQAWIDLQPLIQAIQPLLDIIIDLIGSGVVQAVANAWNAFATAFNGMATLASTVGAMVSAVASAVESLSSALSGVIDKLKSFIGLAGSVSSINLSAVPLAGGIPNISTEQNNVFNVNSVEEANAVQEKAGAILQAFGEYD